MSKLYKCSLTTVFISFNNFFKLEHYPLLPPCSSNYG